MSNELERDLGREVHRWLRRKQVLDAMLKRASAPLRMADQGNAALRRGFQAVALYESVMLMDRYDKNEKEEALHYAEIVVNEMLFVANGGMSDWLS